MDAKALEKVLRRSNKTLDAERAAVADKRWAEYLAERVPAPSRLNFLQHSAWRAAHEQALRIGHTTAVREVLVFPIWYCSNEDEEEPVADWIRAVIVSFEDASFELYEKASLENALVVADVEEARLGFLVHSRAYAPDIKLPFRKGDYATVESRRLERVVKVKTVVGGTSVPVPQREVRPFSTDTEPALVLPETERDLAARVISAAERLRIFP